MFTRRKWRIVFENVAAHRVRYNIEMIKIVGQFL